MPPYNRDSIEAVIARLETKFDGWIEESTAWRKSHEAEMVKLQEAVQGHDRFKYWLAGIAAGAGALGGKLLSLLGTHPGSKP